MKLTNETSLTREANTKHFVYCSPSGEIRIEPSHPLYPAWQELYQAFYHTEKAERDRLASTDLKPQIEKLVRAVMSGATEVMVEAAKEPSNEEKVLNGLQQLLNFFTEFSFEPNFRFVNTISRLMSQKGGRASVKEFIANYFSLTDDAHYKEIAEKVKSREFDNILTLISAVAPTKQVNTRFKVYYGSAGTGKTTKAQAECENRCVVCNNSMLPADLMEDFCFVDGKPSFKPSILWDCMTNGKPIVLDEINLLPFDSLRFLQGVLDGKKEFSYKGREVKIADGFCIIGTMNLVVNGATFNLPEPLVDRCMDIRKFTLSASQLLNAIV